MNGIRTKAALVLGSLAVAGLLATQGTDDTHWGMTASPGDTHWTLVADGPDDTHWSAPGQVPA